MESKQAMSPKASKKVLLVLSSLLPGGAERVTLGIADYLKNAGWEPHLFVARKMESARGLYEVPDGIPVHSLAFGSGNRILRPVLNCALLRKLVSDFSPYWVVSLGAQYKTLALAGCFEKTNVLLSERNYPLSFYDEEGLRQAEEFYRRATKVVFQTEEELECFKGLDRTKTLIIPNAVNGNLPKWTGAVSKRIAFVGRLAEQKNPMLALEAFGRFRQTHDGWCLDFYGDGPLKGSLVEKAQELGISESVVFHGNVSDVVEKVATSDIYISSSDYEGISNSMLEALAMGVPSICTDCAGGGARLAIENGMNGLLVRCGDTDNFADAMARIADNAAFARRMSEAAIESSARFAPSTIYAQWLGALL